MQFPGDLRANQLHGIDNNRLDFTINQRVFWEEQRKNSKNKNTKIKLGKTNVANSAPNVQCSERLSSADHLTKSTRMQHSNILHYTL